jgi:2-amino-4-hydroxy-6-hydroxymethyldihydropteridine diphosphokinase
VKASRLILTKPFGKTDQPDFINAAAIISTELQPAPLMRHLHDIELAAERRRTVRWGPRTLDLDLIDYNGVIRDGNGRAKGHQRALILPHPAIAEREFVLAPIAEIAPDWMHPVLNKTAQELLNELYRVACDCDAAEQLPPAK